MKQRKFERSKLENSKDSVKLRTRSKEHEYENSNSLRLKRRRVEGLADLRAEAKTQRQTDHQVR